MTAPTQPERPPRQEQQEASTEVTEVAPGVLRLQLPITFTGLGHVNCYALCDRDGIALVDPGLPGKDTHLALRARMRDAGLPLERVHSVIVTHSHPDHFGGAGLVADKAHATIVASASFQTWWDPAPDLEEDPATAPHTDPHDDGLAFPSQPRRSGGPFGQPTPWGGTTYKPPLPIRLRFAVRHLVGSRWFKAPTVRRRLDDTQTITLAGREWVALHTPGHTGDHLCLLDPTEGVLLSGDHVLPSITPHLSGMIPGDPLTDYYASLARMEHLDDVRLVLPAHGHPFDDLAERSRAIRQHHEHRVAELGDLLGAADGGASVQELSHALFGRHGADPLAVSETYAHLEHLRIAGDGTRRRAHDRLVYSLADESQRSVPTDPPSGEAISDPRR